MTPRKRLLAARALVADEKTWTTGAAARDSKGCPVTLTNPSATRWCALGALGASGLGLDVVDICDAFCDINLTHTNDVLGREAVLAVFDRVLEEMPE